MDPARICEDLRDQAYAAREKYKPPFKDAQQKIDYDIYSHRADALNQAAEKIRKAGKGRD